MKNISIKIAFLFLFSIVSSFANNNMEDLTLKMTSNQDVISLVKNKMVLGFVNSIDFEQKQVPVEILDKISKLRNQNNSLINSINIAFPEFQKLDFEDRKTIVDEILKSAALNEYWNCIGNKFYTFAITEFGAAFSTAVYGYFKGCAMFALASDIAEEIASGGTATAAVAGEAAPEITFCKWLAGGEAKLISGGLLLLIGSLFGC